MRSPLTAILTEASLLNRAVRGIDDHVPRIARGSQLIESSVKRMNGWIDDLLDVAQLEAGAELHLNLTAVDLVALVREAVADQEHAARRRAPIRVDGVETLPTVLDGSRLRRVLDNVLSNAVKYTPRTGHIVVSLERTEVDGPPSALLTVRDDGMGIPADELPRIFDRYHRARNVGPIHGSGLGLAGARQIVEQHGGTLVVDSTEGQGTLVTVRLPLTPDR